MIGQNEYVCLSICLIGQILIFPLIFSLNNYSGEWLY